MVQVTFIATDGGEQTIDASEGLSLMENAVANGVETIVAVCGGNAYCGTCRVYPQGEWRERLGDAGDIETPMLEAAEDETPGARLSCQIPVTGALDGLVVRTPESQE